MIKKGQIVKNIISNKNHGDEFNTSTIIEPGKFEDHTEISTFLKYYKEKLQKEVNKVTLRGRGIYRPQYYMHSPSLKLAGRSLIPEIKAKPYYEENYYLNIRPFSNGIFGMHYKKTRYRIEKYGEKRLPLNLDVLNSIEPFWGTLEKRKSAKQILKSSEGWKRQKMFEYNTIFRNTNGRRIRHLFDMNLNDALKMFRSPLPPTWIHICPRHGKSWKTDVKEYYDFKGPVFSDKEPVNLDVQQTSEVSFSELDFDQFPSFWWREETSGILGDDTNAELLEFCMDNEIPMLRAVMRKYSYTGVVDDKMLEFFNYISALREFAGTNAINKFLWDMFHFFLFFLYTENKLTQCRHCLRYIPYRKNKKYCSPLTEGRDCGKAARNKRDYQKHKEARLKYYRSEMKLTREMEKRLRVQNK